jgi:hypothetical protein
MLDKRALTTKFLKELGLETNNKNIRKHHIMWWMNPRSRDNNSGYRLTDAGYLMLTEKLGIKSYEISVPENTEWSSGLLLKLDKFLDSPYTIHPKCIVVFKEKTAVELILFEGDIQRYTTAKVMSQKNNT